MSSDRLRQVERNLTRLRQQLAGKEDTLTTIAPEERVRIQRKFSFSDWQSRTTSEGKIEYLLDTYWEATITRKLIIDPNQKQQGIRSKTYGIKPLPHPKVVRRGRYLN